jgi:hypothetical protein
MSKVVYLLGAGASYGKRENAPLKPGVSRIIEGLPVVNEINDEIDVVIQWLNGTKCPKDTYKYEIGGQKYSFDGIKELLTNEFRWLKEESTKHATIDTFARTLLLKGEYSDYVKLKYLLCTFFIIEQTIHPLDKRYDAFFANVLNEFSDMPDDIYIMTWNYDCQLNLAIREYVNSLLYVYEPNDDLSHTDKAKVFKINGTAGYYNAGILVPRNLTEKEKTKLIQRVFRQYVTIANGAFQSDSSLYLHFAWEKDVFEKEKTHLFNHIKDAEVLVVIGYTFPFFNRGIDRQIFSNMPNLKKIYIQDPNADSIKDFIGSVLTEEQSNALLIGVKLIKNVSNFYLPPEL